MTSRDRSSEPLPPPVRRGRLPYGGIPGERELLSRAQAGDRDALDELCGLHWPGIYGLVEASVHDPAEAEEITQEVFERAVRSLPSFRYTGAPYSAFLTRIARNLVRDRWRSRSRREAIESGLGTGAADHVPAPDESVVLTGDQDVVRRALATLSERHRLVLYLRIIEGRSVEETARRLGRRPDAVRQLQHRAVAALRDAVTRIEST